MEVEFAAVLRFDFVLEADGSELEANLDALYSDRTDDVDPAFFGFAPDSPIETRGTGSITCYSGLNAGQLGSGAGSLNEFGSVRSFLLQQDARRFYDLVTVAEFSDDQLETITAAEVETARERVQHWQDQVSRIGRDVESFVFDEDVFGKTYPLSNHAEILYVDPVETRPLRASGSELDRTACRDVVSEPICRRYLLGERGCVSLLGSGELVGTQRLGDVWGPLTAVAVTDPLPAFRIQSKTTFDLPPFGALVNRFLPFLRAYAWVHLRVADAEIIDQELTDTSANVLDVRENDERLYLTKLAAMEDELGQVQKYLDYSKIVQEFDDVVRLIGGYQYGSNHRRVDDYERPLSKPADTTLRSTTYFGDSLFETYRTELTHLLETLESTLDLIDEKQTRISNIITDKVTVTGTKASVELNERVRRLTLVLVVLTIILVFFAVFTGDGFGDVVSTGIGYLRATLELLGSIASTASGDP